MVYYNEFDPKKAAWLRELIKAGAIANGEIDERSISNVRPADVVGYKQWHWFAGIGIWSYALRLAGWPDDRECYTLSCPCQPFSAAGKKKGIEDRRHLWPDIFRIIRERRPVVAFGEQVSSPDGLAWLDIVRSDLEGTAYTFGAVDLCAAGAGAPHIRNRTFFVADATGARRDDQREYRGRSSSPDARLEQCGGIGSMADTVRPERREGVQRQARHEQASGRDESADRVGERGEVERVADTRGERVRTGRFGSSDEAPGRMQGANGKRKRLRIDAGELGTIGGLGDSNSSRSQGRGIGRDGASECAAGAASVAGGMADTETAERRGPGESGDAGRWSAEIGGSSDSRRLANSDGGNPGDGGIQRSRQHRLIPEDGSTPGPTNGFWRDSGWVLCRPERSGGDPSWRPVERGTFPLASGIAGRVGRLRGYGDGIVAPVAAEFIKAYIEEKGL